MIRRFKLSGGKDFPPFSGCNDWGLEIKPTKDKLIREKMDLSQEKNSTQSGGGG